MKARLNQVPYKTPKNTDIWELRNDRTSELMAVLLDLGDGKQLVLHHQSPQIYPVGTVGTWFDRPSGLWSPYEGTITLSNDE